MMTEMILESAALLLSLFCMIDSDRQQRAFSSPRQDGRFSVRKGRQLVYFAALSALALSAAVAVAGSLCQHLGLHTGGVRMLDTAYTVLQILLFLAFGLYAFWLLPHGSAAFRDKRAIVLLLIVVAGLGVAIRMTWEVRVELFFEGMALFGCMVLFERNAAASGRGMDDRLQVSVTFVISLAILTVIMMNVSLILNLFNAQSNEIGNTQLDIIRSDLQDTITEAENDVLRVAIGAEQLLESGAPREEITAYFYEQRDKRLSNDSFLSVYIAGPDWHIIPDFNGPADFHAAERLWYIGAQDCPGKVYITEPYLDANGNGMCFTVSTLLSDGETVVGMDLNFSKTQESIFRMTKGRDSTAMIVTSGGLIAGYTDMSLVGERADEKLPEYAGILRRVSSSQEHGSFQVELDGHPCMIFSSETSNNWYLILSVDTSSLYGESYRQVAIMASVNLLMLAVVVVYFILSTRKTRQAEKDLADSRSFLESFSVRLRELAAHLLRLGDARLFKEGEDPGELIEQVQDSGRQLSEHVTELKSFSEMLRHREYTAQTRKRAEPTEAPSRKVRNGIILSLIVSLVIILVFCISISVNLGTARMNREADHYENQLDEWLTQQKSILYMFTDMISSRPDLLGDYESAVRWLRDISRSYPDISLCFMANPYSEHPVIMSNGWEPGEDYRPETRPWYRETERSTEGFSISEPYLDAQSGNYCITLSRVVNGQQGEFLGIFGIDFFLDKLILVLGESYTSRSYAFLVDTEGVIINHPNERYQMGEEAGTSIEDTEYADAYHRDGVTPVRDYASHLMACLNRRTGSGFTVLVANRWWSIYGSVVLVSAVVLLLFSVCLLFVVALINRLIHWQEDVNRQLVASAEEARNANRAKSQFLSQMSHEIRTAMNAIIGLDSIALRDENIPAHTREKLEKIGASARHLLALINDILDMSRIESGRMVLREDLFSFREFLEQICIIVGGQCEDKGLRFVCNKVGTLDDFFVGDDLKLKQVLINILGNSVKFTDAPGVITFSVEQSVLADNKAALRFTMEDTGIGMDKEFLPRLFEAFSQEDSGNTTCYGGSGLGMAITKSIVDMMGGEIGVESEKGLGTTFTVTVTLGRADATMLPASAAEEVPAAHITLEGRHMLIVEDQPMNAEVLGDLLELEDMSSEWAENGQRAVEMFGQSEPGHFDAILMDMRMPVMDGLSATREIRKLSRPDAKSIPIIALSANAFEEDVRKCLEAGMNAHLSKPVDIDRLVELLARLIAAQS